LLLLIQGALRIKVIEEYGGRKKNNIIEELIDKYLKEKEI
jgi:hypothetical protein